MKFVIDESVDYRIVTKLKTQELDIYSIQDNNPGISDERVLKIAYDLNAVLITEDKDFGELTHRLKLPNKGILLIRLSELPSDERIVFSVDTIIDHSEELYLSFSVLTTQGLRIKKLQEE